MTDPLFRYPATSRAFLARAKETLATFDSEGSVSSFFTTALLLRFGIEARLFEFLDATLDQMGKKQEVGSEYVASKLLKRLVEENLRAESDVAVRITSERTGESTTLGFTPVSRELASMHGKLGGLLHFSFFRNNPDWYVRTESSGQNARTLLDHRRLLDQAISELTRATAGTLLSHPRFEQTVADVLGEG